MSTRGNIVMNKQRQLNETENEKEEGGENKKVVRENGSFLEYLDKLCCDENFVRMVGTTLNIDYLDSLLSPDPEPLDLLALEKRDQQITVQEKPHQLSTDSNNNLVATSLVGTTLNIDYLDSLLSPDPESLDLLALEKRDQQITLQEKPHQLSADSSNNPAATSLVGTTLNIDFLESLLSSDPEPLDLLALEKQDQQVTLQEQSHQLSADSSNNPDATSLVATTLNIDYLESLLSSDPESLDLLELEKQDQQVATTLNIDYLESLLSSDPEPLDLLALEKQDQQVT
ncbi:hypothetical protein Q8A73_013206 [Channa argus]|nr:hypothetical protein Q8A73_013206 [Channa argus]